ncbi:hypothetical protein M0805_002635 [Coniferiporia weirii]|nr:hypothetical protein M0805_002635 [Coniferiporia weirii]
MCCASREASPKPKRQRALRKAMSEEEKEEAVRLRLKRKAERESKGMYKSDAKTAYDLTEKDLATLRHESIQSSRKTFFSHRQVKKLAIRKYIALTGDSLENIQFGFVRLFTKADVCPNRRTRQNWKDLGDAGEAVLKTREENEKNKLAKYAKKVEEQQKLKMRQGIEKKQATKMKRQQEAELRLQGFFGGLAGVRS